VEDQPVRALNLQIAPEEAGAEAVVARGPQEARAQLQQFRFSVAIIDPGQRLLVRELEERKVPIVAKLASRSELFRTAGARSGTADAYFSRACWSNTLSTASVMASTPVSMVGFGTGANKGEWLVGSCGPSPSRAAATRSGS
jgi:hypothetical protein